MQSNAKGVEESVRRISAKEAEVRVHEECLRECDDEFRKKGAFEFKIKPESFEYWMAFTIYSIKCNLDCPSPMPFAARP